MSTIDLKRFHATYFAESLQSLDTMESDLLLIEKGERNPELMNAVFRAVHSVKGSGGSLGFDAIADFSHHLESLLDDVRKGLCDPDAPMIDVMAGQVPVRVGPARPLFGHALRHPQSVHATAAAAVAAAATACS